MNKKTNVYNIIIYILIFLIISVGVLLLLNDKKEDTTNNTEPSNETPTPVPTPPPTSSILTISLKGDNPATIIKGQKYDDRGYTANDSIEGDLTNRVTIEGTVNTNEVGTYTITYKVVNSNKYSTERIRTVKVIEDLDISIDYSPKELTNKEVTINLKITGDCLSSVELPNGQTISNKIIEYKVTKNNNYIFLIKRTDGSIIEKEIKIDNIDKEKPTGTCKNTVYNNKTVITVNSKDKDISKYTYGYNSKTKDLTINTYTVNEVANNVTVTIYDKVGNNTKITCTKIDESWPIIKDQNYQNHTASNYKVLKYGRLNYLLYYPNGLDLSKKSPLVIHLHGIGEFGTNINNTLAGSSAFANNMRYGRFQQKAIFLAPQCSSGSKKWKDCFSDLKGLISILVKQYNIDTNRISMAGHSLGGQAVFDFIAENPGYLAAAAPLSPSYPWNHNYNNMKNMKIAVFIGTEEGLYTRDQPEIEYLQKNGVNLKFFPLQGITHSSQKAFYNGTNIIDWLISQSK